ncbi:MAG TPA: ABC transporter substrate-binding protein [Alphaproteobacteria bacterium]|nr:ABC transporter substrate-binding protein [Alphaproteobacteria bacterium]
MKTILLTTFLSGALLGAGQAQADIKVGVLYPTSGGGAIYGTPAMQGHTLALKEINASGGILGQKVVSFARDSKLNPAAASAAAKELIAKEGVTVILGGVASSVGLALSEVSKQEKVIYIATIPKSIKITTTKLHPYVFRTASNTDFEGDAMATIMKQVGGEKICDIQLDYAYGHDLAKGIKKALPQHAPDAQVILDLWPKLGATDYNAYITQIMGAGCDTVTSGLWGNHFVNFAKQAKPFGLFKNVKFIAGGEVGSHEVASKMGEDYPDNVWSNSYELWYHIKTDAHRKFHEALAKTAGTEETAMWPVLAYNGLMFYKAAVEKAGSTDPDKVSKALEGLTIQTPVGALTINPADHQANTGQFWGKMVKVQGKEYREMDAHWVPPPPSE